MTNTILFQVLKNKNYSVWTAQLILNEMIERVQSGEEPETVLLDEDISLEYENDLIEAAHEF